MLRTATRARALVATCVALIVGTVALPTEAQAASDLPTDSGATITGRLIGPDGAPLVGTRVSAEGESESFQDAFAITDATGRYTFVRLQSDVYELFLGAAGEPGRLNWKTRVFAERPGHPATHVSLSTKLVHTWYDLSVGVAPAADAESVVGATVRATNTITGTVYEQRTGGVTGTVQKVHFVVPSGTYTVQLVTASTPQSPSQTWWYTGQGVPMSGTATDATLKPVKYSQAVGAFLQVPVSVT